MNNRTGTGLRRGSASVTLDMMTMATKQEPNDLEELHEANELVYDGHFLYPGLQDAEELEESGNQGQQEGEEEDSEISTFSSEESSNQEMSEEENQCEHRLFMGGFKREIRQPNKLNSKEEKENEQLKAEIRTLKDKVSKLEQDKYSLGIIADYEIGKLKKKLIDEKRRRVLAENTLKELVRQSSVSFSSDGFRDQQVVDDGRQGQLRQVGDDDDEDIQIIGVVEKSVTSIGWAELFPSSLDANKELPPVVQEGIQNQHQNLYKPRQRPGPKSKTRPINTASQPIRNGIVNAVQISIPSALEERDAQRALNQRPASVPIQRRSLVRARRLSLLKRTSLSSRSDYRNVSSADVPKKSRPDYKFRCNVCNTSFFKMSSLKIHKLTVHNIDDKELDGIGCVDCGLTFVSSKEHMSHRAIVHGTRVGKKRKGERNTSRAVDQKSETETPKNVGIKIAETTTTCTSSRVLPKRIRKIPNRIASSLANIYVAANSSSICGPPASNKHRLIGADPKKPTAVYRCSCGKVYQKRKSFRTHMRFKNGGKIFNCTRCEKSFDNHSSLKQHVRCFHQIEYEDSRYACGTCGLRGLETLQDLNHHRAVAHGMVRSGKQDN